MVQKQAVVINSRDNVATAVANLAAGSTVNYFIGQDVEQMLLTEEIPIGHKFAIRDIDIDKEIIKYGEVIGNSLIAINKGQHVHVHNIQSNRGRGDRN